MTKSDLIDVLCETQKIPKGRAELLVQVIFESMEEALKRGERIEIRGFGSFELRSYKPYEGRNPRTGVRVNVQPKRLPFFKVGKELKERVNAGRTTVRAAVPGWTDGARLAKVDGKAAAKPASNGTTNGDGTPTVAPVTATGPVPEATAAQDPAPAGTATRVSA
jgi:integration host factor subunit beta